jgi:hypothetical protein
MVVAIDSPQGDHADDHPAVVATSAAHGTSPNSPADASAAATPAATVAMAYGSTASRSSRSAAGSGAGWVETDTSSTYEQNHRRHLMWFAPQSFDEPFVCVW